MLNEAQKNLEQKTIDMTRVNAKKEKLRSNKWGGDPTNGLQLTTVPLGKILRYTLSGGGGCLKRKDSPESKGTKKEGEGQLKRASICDHASDTTTGD